MRKPRGEAGQNANPAAIPASPVSAIARFPPPFTSFTARTGTSSPSARRIFSILNCKLPPRPMLRPAWAIVTIASSALCWGIATNLPPSTGSTTSSGTFSPAITCEDTTARTNFRRTRVPSVSTGLGAFAGDVPRSDCWDWPTTESDPCPCSSSSGSRNAKPTCDVLTRALNPRLKARKRTDAGALWTRPSTIRELREVGDIIHSPEQVYRVTGQVVYRVRDLKRELESADSRTQTDQLIEFVKRICANFKRGDGAGIVVFPRPNPQTAPCGRGTSKRGERTCWPSDWWLLFRGTSQSASECRDSSKV